MSTGFSYIMQYHKNLLRADNHHLVPLHRKPWQILYAGLSHHRSPLLLMSCFIISSEDGRPRDQIGRGKRI